MKRICILFYLALILLQASLKGEIQISESVTQFRYPKFSDNGFIEWVLEGNSGTHDESNIHIEGMNLRIYSGDQSARSLSNISGENCLFDNDRQSASSEDAILIKGSGFELTGNQWTYNLSEKTIIVNSDAFVRFSQNIDSIFSEGEQAGETKIQSNRMHLIIEPSRYLFVFEGNCTLSSDAFNLKTKILKLELLNNSKKISFSIPSGQLSGMHSIQGEGDVQFIGMGQTVTSDKFTLQPQESKARFTGDAEIFYKQIALKGDLIELNQNQVEVSSFNRHLSSFSKSDYNDKASLPDEPSTLIQSKNISLLKKIDAYEYIFDGDVFFRSELYKIHSQWLFLKTAEALDSESSKTFHDIILTEAKEGIILNHKDYQISGDYLHYLPLKNQIEIRDKVNYVSDFAKLNADHLILEQQTLKAFSELNPIQVILPYSDNLNFELQEDLSSKTQDNEADTIVYAKDLILYNEYSSYHCIFNNDVRLINDDFSLISDELKMEWQPMIQDDSKYALKTIEADGSVKVEEMNYFASANHVEILPGEQSIHLMGDANFKDENGLILGERIVFDRQSKQTKIIGSTNGERARIQLDLFNQEEENLEESEKE